MKDSPAYKKGNVIEVQNYLNCPLSLKPMKFFIEDVEDIKGSSKLKRSFDEEDFYEELRRNRKLSFIFDERYLNSVPSLKGIGFIGSNKKENASAWKNFDEYGIYGDIEKKFTYFTTSATIALNHTSAKGLNNVEMIEIDNTIISKNRKIFFDLESFFFVGERGKTFVVMGGVPKESINRIYHMKKIQ